MRAFIELYRSNLREWRRDPTALLWSLIFPIMLMLFTGLVFYRESGTRFDLGVVNETGESGQVVIEAFRQMDTFNLAVHSRAHELNALQRGERQAVILIPASGSQIEIYYADADPHSATILALIQTGIAQTSSSPPRWTTHIQTASARHLDRTDLMLPGILGINLMQLGLFLTAAPLVALREQKVLRRMGATPLRRTTMLASQIAFRVTLAVMEMIIVLLIGVLLFDVDIAWDNLPAIIGVVLLGAALFVTLGYFLAGLAQTEEAIQGLIGIPNVVFMMLSNIFFPIDDMPTWIRPVVDALPLTYLVDALRQTMLDTAGRYTMSTNLIAMTAWTIICAGLAIWRFRWE